MIEISHVDDRDFINSFKDFNENDKDLKLALEYIQKGIKDKDTHIIKIKKWKGYK